MPLILEGIVTTVNEDGSPNISPMGPLVSPEMKEFVLRPYTSSQTYANLKRNPAGVLHVTDDVLMLAQAATNQLQPLPRMERAAQGNGWILSDACRWYAFEVAHLDDRQERTTIACRVVERGRLRDFFGFNRAKHACIEAAILATRVQFLSEQEIRQQLDKLHILIEKTAGPQEREAFELLRHFCERAWGDGEK